MGERLLCKQEVIGSIPFTSTTSMARGAPTAVTPLPREGVAGPRCRLLHHAVFVTGFARHWAASR